MKIAILILAHKNVWQLGKLVERLSTDFDIYIHADKKWKIDTAMFSRYENVFFVKRFSPNWGSFTFIAATIELFKKSFQRDYDYYMLISGQDLPLESNDAIKTYLEANNYTNFLTADKLPLKGWAGQNGGFDRLNYYYGNDFKKGILGSVKARLTYLFQAFQKKMGTTRKLYPIDYYGGGVWVNIDNSTMMYVINFMERNPSFIDTFKYTYCADEIWLQTIVMNSGTSIVNDYSRYIEWDAHSPNPKTFTMDDLQSLKASNDLFARKFDENIDKEVINSVYEMTK